VAFGYGGTTSAFTSATSGFTFDSAASETPVATGGAIWGVSTGGKLGTDLAGYTTGAVALTYPVSSGSATASFGITPWVDSSFNTCSSGTAVALSSTATVDYSKSLCPTVHGFAAETVTIYVGGVKLGTVTAGSTGTPTTQMAATQVPDLASGSQAITATGALSAASGTANFAAVYTTAELFTGTAGQTDLTVTSGAPGTLTILRTGVSSNGFNTANGPFGVHGLAASTAYQVTWGIGTGAAVVATFTSTATGGISGGGLQFNAPSGTVGYHILDLRLASTGADVLFGSTTAGDAASSFTTAPAQTGQFGDLLFSLTASITPTPTVGTVGASVSVAGSGLSPTTTYYVHIIGKDVTYNTYSGTYQATFTSTATGSIPTGTSFTFPQAPAAAGGENATGYYLCVDTTTVGTTANSAGCTNTGIWVLQASATLSSSSTTPGTSLTISATGLDASSTYNVVMNKVTVAALLSNSAGSGSATFTVPSTIAPGSYPVYLTAATNEVTGFAGKRVLVSPPSLTVSASATGGLTAQTLSSSGAPTEAAVNGQATVSQTFTNTASSQLSVYMWVSVQNAAGQTVGVFLGSATIAAGGSATIAAALFNLPSGSYTATAFVTTTSGIVVSSTSSTSSFSL